MRERSGDSFPLSVVNTCFNFEKLRSTTIEDSGIEVKSKATFEIMRYFLVYSSFDIILKFSP